MSIHDTSSPQVQEPKQPQFVGPTRSAFSLKVAETSLTRMGISAQTPLPSGVCESLAPTRAFVEDSPDRPATAGSPAVDIKDVILAKVAIATSIVVEAHGKNHASNKLVEPLKHLIYQLSIDAQADLKVIQIMTMISIYYFFSDEELLAWRNIGIAARAALEMGLHQNLSLVENFPDERERGLAVRVFCLTSFPTFDV
ncbi:putative transcriptional regulatory protein [Colletotrichum sp. SAR11_240]|nr:putative transcriptional regulatory protein [Colletotrichum sp. SAR11_240]